MNATPPAAEAAPAGTRGDTDRWPVTPADPRPAVAVFTNPRSPRVPVLLARAAAGLGADVRHVDVASLRVRMQDAQSPQPAGGVADAAGTVTVTHAGPLLAYGHPTSLVALAALRRHGVVVLNDADAVAVGDDKAATALRFAAAGVPQPRTIAVDGARRSIAAAAAEIGYPVVVKTAAGAQGYGVRRLACAGDLNGSRVASEGAASEGAAGVDAVVVQESVDASFGRSVRVICVDGDAVAATLRQGPVGSLVSNVAAAAATGLRLAGVDLLLSDDGPLALEVNTHPDFSSMAAVLDVDVASHIASALLGDRPRR